MKAFEILRIFSGRISLRLLFDSLRNAFLEVLYLVDATLIDGSSYMGLHNHPSLKIVSFFFHEESRQEGHPT